MPSPNPTLGNAPHDIDDVQDIWYALQELELTTGIIAQADYSVSNDEPIAAATTLSKALSAPGGTTVSGQVRSSGRYGVVIRWTDKDGALVREQEISSNVKGNQWTDFSIEGKSPFVEIAVTNTTAAQQIVDISIHYR